MKLAILGASGHGSVVADAAISAGWDVTFFDDTFPATSACGPWPVAGTTADLVRDARTFDGALVAIGDNAARLAKLEELASRGVRIVSVIHPSAVVSGWAEAGAGSVVFAGAVINPFATLGRGCIVNTGATVDHHCVLADGVHVAPGAHLGGTVTVGEATWIGIGASVRHKVRIGARVTVGAGAAVVADIADGLTVVGVPARPLAR